MAKRKRINWDFIEPLYRMGGLSNCEIVQQYKACHKNSDEWKGTVSEGAIRKQAKLKVWEKNLAGRVSEQIKEKLVRAEVRDSNLDDDGIVNAASETGANVVLRHRDEIAALSATEANLLLELDGLTDDTSLKDKTICLKNIAHVRAQRIALERQTFNIDDAFNPRPDTSPTKSIKNLSPDEMLRVYQDAIKA